jgi:type I restriction enzyme R subunit
LPIKHLMAPSTMTVPLERIDREFFALAEAEGVSDIEELNRVLDRAVGLRAFLKADERVTNVAKFIADHFRENVLPLGYKAFVVAVDREACAKYKRELDKHLPPEWSEAIYTSNVNDEVERPDVAALQLSDERESDVRLLFKKAAEEPKILIVTDKLLTGYDAPLLYAMYLDKPMRDHVLLQAIARVNRPYVDSEGVRKPIGLVVDFVSVLRDLKKALKFDSEDVSGVIEDLDLLLTDFLAKIAAAKVEYLDAGDGGGADERLEALVYGKFLDSEPRKAFFETYKDIENLWEILSPSAELVDHIATYKRLAQLYATVRNAYADQVGFVADLAYKTRRLVEANAEQSGLGNLTKSATFDVKTLDALRDGKGSDEGKVFNLLRGFREEIDDDQGNAPILQPLKDRAERILKDMESRNVTGLAAMDLLGALAAEKEALLAEAKESGLSPDAFGIMIALRGDDAALSDGEVDARQVAGLIDELRARYPNAKLNDDERRRLRGALYLPLLDLTDDDRTRIVDLIMRSLLS